MLPIGSKKNLRMTLGWGEWVSEGGLLLSTSQTCCDYTRVLRSRKPHDPVSCSVVCSVTRSNVFTLP